MGIIIGLCGGIYRDDLGYYGVEGSGSGPC